MEIQVSRQAVCAADDQRGPLEILIHVEPNSSIQEFVTVLENTKFLQFSSSHTSILGLCESVPVVRVFSPFFLQNQNQYFVPQNLSVSEAIKNGALYFKF